MKERRIHPQYDPRTTDYDAAILKIHGRFNYLQNKNIKSIPLTVIKDMEELVGLKAMVLGMGLLRVI